MSFIAGPYTLKAGPQAAAWDAGALSSLGCTDEGINLEITPSVQPITCDQYGDTMLDGVYRGGNMYLDFVLQEAELAEVEALFWPFGDFGELGTPGTLLSSYARHLLLEAVSGTPAASGSYANISTTSAVLAPNYPLRLLKSTRLKNVPLRLQLLPFTYDSGKYFFRPVADPTSA